MKVALRSTACRGLSDKNQLRGSTLALGAFDDSFPAVSVADTLDQRQAYAGARAAGSLEMALENFAYDFAMNSRSRIGDCQAVFLHRDRHRA